MKTDADIWREVAIDWTSPPIYHSPLTNKLPRNTDQGLCSSFYWKQMHYCKIYNTNFDSVNWWSVCGLVDTFNPKTNPHSFQLFFPQGTHRKERAMIALFLAAIAENP